VFTIPSLPLFLGRTNLRDEYIFLDDNINVVSPFVFFKERKAAKLSKEALKKMHSETQRLIRGNTNQYNKLCSESQCFFVNLLILFLTFLM
jgi:hypothetical protein